MDSTQPHEQTSIPRRELHMDELSQYLEGLSVTQFQHHPLTTEGGFRLLKLKQGTGRYIYCELIHSYIDDREMEYEAVSYTWGTERNADKVLFYNEATGNTEQLGVSLNLISILHDLRLNNQDRILWIDAICINQEDILERSIQVQRMGDIYRHASRVLFCIARPTELTDILFQVVSRLENHPNTKDPGMNLAERWKEQRTTLLRQYYGLVPRMSKAIAYILQQPWFRRVWIVQEVVNAKAALVYCGPHPMSSAAFVQLPYLSSIAIEEHCGKILQMMPSPNRLITRGVRPLLSLMKDLEASQATDERDKIFALLDLCSDTEARHALCPDYSKSEAALVREAVDYFCSCSSISLVLPWNSVTDLIANTELITKQWEKGAGGDSVDPNERQYWRHWRKICDGIHCTLLMNLLCISDDQSAVSLLQNHYLKLHAHDDLVQAAVLRPRSTVADWITRIPDFDVQARTIIVPKNGFIHKIPISAVENGHFDFVSKLLDLGVNMDAVVLKESSKKYPDPHYWELTNRSPECLKGYASRSELGNMLIFAIIMKQEAIVELLLRRGMSAAPHRRPEQKPPSIADYPILLAAALGYTPIVQLLLEYGADIETQDEKNARALHHAIINGHTETVVVLLERGADLSAEFALTKDCNWSVAHLAATQEDPGILSILLEHGADASEELVCDGQISPLMVAIWFRRTEVMAYLLDKGVNIPPLAPFLALDRASTSQGSAVVLDLERYAPSKEKGSIEPFKVLVAKMAAECLTSTASLIVAVAAALGPTGLQVIPMMVDAGIDMKSDAGNLAMHIAELVGDLQMIELLRKYGADIADARGSAHLRTESEKVVAFLTGQIGSHEQNRRSLHTYFLTSFHEAVLVERSLSEVDHRNLPENGYDEVLRWQNALERISGPGNNA